MTTFIRLTFVTLIAALATIATDIQAQDAYRIRSGDILRIEVIEDPDLNRSVLVSPDGRISVPLAGTLPAAGRSIEQIQADLTSQLSGSFANPPTVFVGIEQLRPVVPATPQPPMPDPIMSIFVVGEAQSAGKLELAPGTTLLQAIAQFGGFSNFAATQRIQLRRGTEIYLINYDAILAGTSPNGRVTMAEGDVIVVPQRRLFE